MKRKVSLMLIVLILCFSFTPVGAVEIDREKFSEDLEFMKNVIYFVLDRYQYEVSPEDIMNGLYDGFFSILDDYSTYYTPKEYDALLEDTAGEFSGIVLFLL
jgi:carboxyl-terminal processing protease